MSRNFADVVVVAARVPRRFGRVLSVVGHNIVADIVVAVAVVAVAVVAVVVVDAVVVVVVVAVVVHLLRQFFINKQLIKFNLKILFFF